MMMSIACQTDSTGVGVGFEPNSVTRTFSDGHLQHHSPLLFRGFIDFGYDRYFDELQTLRRPHPKPNIHERVQPALDESYNDGGACESTMSN